MPVDDVVTRLAARADEQTAEEERVDRALDLGTRRRRSRLASLDLLTLATNKPAEFVVLRISQDTRALEAELAAAGG